jgi:hypothetical protein
MVEPASGEPLLTEVAVILASLHRRYKSPEWAFFVELRTGTGYNYMTGYGYRGEAKIRKNVERRLDAWAFHLWPSGGYQPTGFEIKTSRSDFLLDVKTPAKRVRYLELCQFFYYVTPSGLVQPHEVPDEIGLIWVDERGCRLKKKAPNRGMPEPEWEFFAAICRRVDAVTRKGSPDAPS